MQSKYKTKKPEENKKLFLNVELSSLKLGVKVNNMPS